MGRATDPVSTAALAIGFDRPRYHFTGATTALVKGIRPGDAIWLVGQLATPWGKLPVSLDARIDVAACEAGPDGYTFLAGETSRWFPLADAAAELPKLFTRRKDGSVAPLTKNSLAPIGLVLQQLRKLNDARLLIEWVQMLDKKGYDFVSYRLRDGTHKAFDAVATLMAEGKAVFWDRWSLPRQLTENQRPVENELLKTHIEYMIQHANTVWGIATGSYAEKNSFSAYERGIAEKLGHFSNW